MVGSVSPPPPLRLSDFVQKQGPQDQVTKRLDLDVGHPIACVPQKRLGFRTDGVKQNHRTPFSHHPTRLTMPQGRRMPSPLGAVWKQLRFSTRPPCFTDARLYTLVAFCCLVSIKVQHMHQTKKAFIYTDAIYIEAITCESMTITKTGFDRHVLGRAMRSGKWVSASFCLCRLATLWVHFGFQSCTACTLSDAVVEGIGRGTSAVAAPVACAQKLIQWPRLYLPPLPPNKNTPNV